MKPYSTRILFVAVFLFAAFSSYSQLTENFNSRTGVTANQVKAYLQANCWQFSGFVSGPNAGAMEGDGSLFLDSANSPQTATLYTPVLNGQGSTSISFSYQFSKGADYTRWIKLVVVNALNQLVKVADSIEIKNTAAQTVYTYNKTVETGTGVYKIGLQYSDAVRSTTLALDQLQISASKHYASGCNGAPVAVADAFSGGAPGSPVSGNVLQNDRDPDGENLSAYLISGSADGTVNLLSNGAFTFVPRAGFNGSSTSFAYKACDDGYGQLCSQTAYVTIFFSPGNIVPIRFVEFTAAYESSEVKLNWVTAYENSTESFDVERGTDSLHLKKLGTVRGYGMLGSINFYKYSDAQSPEIDKYKDLYYRLKSTDADGKIVYSKILKVRIEGISGLRSVKVMPNPVVDNIKLSLQLNRSCAVTVKVMNGTGNEVYNDVVQGEPGQNRVTLTGTSQLPKGLYFVQVLIDKKEKLLTKLIKN
ncbi:MAG: cadherin-like domain-containing protein [Williamsia sp.]|nr:cadherin-like domain-containing protein [Williamsia sp.]